MEVKAMTYDKLDRVDMLFLGVLIGLAVAGILFYVVIYIDEKRLRRSRPQARRIVLKLEEIEMTQSFNLKVGKTYLITPSGVDDSGAAAPASQFSYSLNDTTFGTLTPSADGSNATLAVAKAGTAVLLVGGKNDNGDAISGEGDFTAASVATSIQLNITEQ